MRFLLLRITREKLGDVMAKNDVEKLQEVEEEQNSPGFFQKLFFWFLIPLVFTLAILLIIATFTDTNVFKMADGLKEKIPFISSEEGETENASLSEEKVVKLQAEIQEKEAEIEKLQEEIDSTTTTNEELQTEQERLLYEIEQLKRAQEESQLEFQEILKTFENMSAKTAAPILTEMSDAEALRIMSSMKSDTLAAIFAKMSPADAARYTELLSQQ
ncbi:MotE family protein [Lysinibacillus sp. 3P01SB]|uniref:MotE family protein n=1 Tax=Lysinibacillus sp. 3P01SB TaxID=3132284 RepID=UPI0039A66E31